MAPNQDTRRDQSLSHGRIDILVDISQMPEDPYLVLGVSRVAGDAEIRKAYLKLLRAHPPEKSPDMFKRVRQAYESLQTPRQRAIALLGTPHHPGDDKVTLPGETWDGPDIAGIPLATFLAADPFSDLPIKTPDSKQSRGRDGQKGRSGKR